MHGCSCRKKCGSFKKNEFGFNSSFLASGLWSDSYFYLYVMVGCVGDERGKDPSLGCNALCIMFFLVLLLFCSDRLWLLTS